MTKIPFVSVIIPMFNAEKYIDVCLLSILSQSLENIEIIVVDDKSLDASVKKVERLAHDDARIKLIQLKKNSGPGVARNIGIKHASGKYCMFMDADDMYFDKESIEFVYNLVEKNSLLVACCDKIDFDSQSAMYIPNSSIRTGEYILYSKDISSVFWYTTYIYNREFILEKKIYFPEIRIFEDPVFLAKILREIDKIYCSNRPIYVYRLMHKKAEYSLDKIKTILSAQEDIRRILSDDYNIWKCQYVSLLNVISDGRLYKNISSDAIECLCRIQKIIRSFPKELGLKSNMAQLLLFAIFLNIGRGINSLLPIKYKKVMKIIARKLHILE